MTRHGKNNIRCEWRNFARNDQQHEVQNESYFEASSVARPLRDASMTWTFFTLDLLFSLTFFTLTFFTLTFTLPPEICAVVLFFGGG